jgi:SAM-dependent methyltransferase
VRRSVDSWKNQPMPENHFRGRVATTYDVRSAAMFEPHVIDPALSFLADLAGSGDALEFAIGTGRVALPLSQRGVRVRGIELSPDMVKQLRAKPGAEAIDVTIGDIADTRVSGTFSLVYLVWNTITNLLTQEAQVQCFQNAARHLGPGGYFVIEVYVPELRRLPPGEKFYTFDATSTHVGIEEYDTATQIAYSHHYFLDDERMEVSSAPYRYVWPSELDLMARLAGMNLRERWSTWHRDPFTHESRSHISVWEMPSS